MKKLRNIFVLLIITISVLLTACATPSAPGNTQATVLVTDSIGRQVKVPEKVERIAALYSWSGYAVCLLGSGNDLVAVPGGLKRDVLLVQMFPEIANASVPREGGTINVEELMKIKPDLIIVRNDQVADEKEVEDLDNTGVPYIVVDFSTMKEQQDALLVIGKAIGREAEAGKFNGYYQDAIDRVSRGVADIPEDEKIKLYHSENQANRATPADSVSADITRAVGVINVSVGQDLQLIGSDYYASIEQILLWDPEVIIANETTAYDLIKGSPQWSGITAVRTGRVYRLPNGISRWAHPSSVETPLALLWIAKTVYPDRFTGIEMKAEVRYYYKTFFNLELDDETIYSILAGDGMREPK